MHIKDLFPGENSGPFEASVVSRNKIHQNLLRAQLSDFTGKVNLIFEGEELVKALEKVKPDTKINLKNFFVTDETALISSYFPTFVDTQSIACMDTELNWYILVSRENKQFPAILFKYDRNQVELNSGTNLDYLDVSSLYEVSLPSSHHKLKGPSNDKYVALDYIKDSIRETAIVSSCYGVLLDSTRSYTQTNSPDFKVTLKISDPTIYPQIATVVIFHKESEELPKVCSIGDIVRIDQFRFKKYNESLNIICKSNAKQAGLFLFHLEQQDLSPYASYRSHFSQGQSHYHKLHSLRTWVKHQFSSQVPNSITSTKPLDQTPSQEEIDILARVFGVYKLGIGQFDPSTVVVYNGKHFAQCIVPHEKSKLLQWLQPGDCVRFRSVKFSNCKIILTVYSDILKVQGCFRSLQLPSMPENEDQLKLIASNYTPPPEHSMKTGMHPSAKTLPLFSFNQLKRQKPGANCRIEGYVVKIDPQSPAEIWGLFCANCNQKTNEEICECGNETDVRCDLEFLLWDGEENEKNLIKVVVKEQECSNFLRGQDWDSMKKHLMQPFNKVELGIQVGQVFQVFKTVLVL